MRRKVFDNILKSGCAATSSDFTPEDKKTIFAVMSAKGMSDGTAYNRFFRDGFVPWEIRGIEKVITDYVIENDINDGIVSDYVTFYKNLENKSAFKRYMNDLGMGFNTTIFRFSGFNFRQWELEGIERIINNDLSD